LRTIVNLVSKTIRAILSTMLLVSVLLICSNAFGRYLLHAPVIWAEEVLGYSLVWMVYLGAILVTASDQHLKMDLIAKLMGPKTQTVLQLIGRAVFIICGLLIVYQAPQSISQFTHRSQVADLPMQIVHMVIPVSFAVIVLLIAVLAIKDLRALTGDRAATGR